MSRQQRSAADTQPHHLDKKGIQHRQCASLADRFFAERTGTLSLEQSFVSRTMEKTEMTIGRLGITLQVHPGRRCRGFSVSHEACVQVTFILLLLFLLGSKAVGAFRYECQTEWQKGYGIPNACHVADVNDNGLSELLVASMEGFVHVAGSYDSTYVTQWTSPNLGRYAVLSISDTDGDGVQEIISGGEAGYIYVFGFNGIAFELEWQSEELDSRITGIDVGDLDNDEQPEVVVRTASQLYVFGHDSDSYELEWHEDGFSSYHFLRCLGIGDTDGDGTQEMITLSNAPTDSYVYVFGHDGSTYVREWIDSLSCLTVGVGDTDGDTICEIILGMNRISVYKYDGGTYNEVWADTSIQPLIPTGFRVSDVDGDSMAEIIAMLTIDYDGYVCTYGYDGNTYHREWQSANLSSFCSSNLGVGDPDNDDTVEIITANWDGVIFIFGHNNDNYQLEWMNEELGLDAFGLDLGDVDHDGRTDMIWGDVWAYVYVYDGVTHEEQWRSEDLNSEVRAVASGDVDDDSEAEFVVGDSSGCIHLFEYNGSSFVQEWESNLGSEITGLAIGDVDSDGIREIAVAYNTYTIGWKGSVCLFEFDGEDYQLEWQSDVENRVEGMHVGDVDNDDVAEFITSDAERLHIFGFTGTGYELEAQVDDFIGGWPQPYGLAVADVNSDGLEEITVGTKYGFVSVFHFDGENYVREWRSDDLGFDAFGIGAGDVDQNGDLEIIVGVGTPYTEGAMYIFEYEDSLYQEEWSSSELGYEIGRYNSIKVGDIDADEDAEVILSTRAYAYVLGFASTSISAHFIRADANSDSAVMMEDAVYTLRYLYVPGSDMPSCLKAADTNDDGEIVLSDAIYTLRYLYVPGSPQPPAPFPDCGVDPTEDDMTCGSHPCMDGAIVPSKRVEFGR